MMIVMGLNFDDVETRVREEQVLDPIFENAGKSRIDFLYDFLYDGLFLKRANKSHSRKII